jgi:NAD(P)H-flavin reductase
MILDLLDRRVEQRIDLLFGTRREVDLLYPEEFLHLASRFENFHYHPSLSRFGDDDWRGLRGRVTAVLPHLLGDLPRRDVYICGNDGMIRETTALLIRLGCDRSSIYREGG